MWTCLLAWTSVSFTCRNCRFLTFLMEFLTWLFKCYAKFVHNVYRVQVYIAVVHSHEMYTAGIVSTPHFAHCCVLHDPSTSYYQRQIVASLGGQGAGICFCAVPPMCGPRCTATTFSVVNLKTSLCTLIERGYFTQNALLFLHLKYACTLEDGCIRDVMKTTFLLQSTRQNQSQMEASKLSVNIYTTAA